MKNKLFAILITLVGIALTIYSITLIKNNDSKQNTYIETTATIVKYETCDTKDISKKRYIAEYYVDRNQYQLKSNVCTNMPKALNEEVAIKYNPDNPADAIIANDKTSYIASIIGILFTICGIILIFKKN